MTQADSTRQVSYLSTIGEMFMEYDRVSRTLHTWMGSTDTAQVRGISVLDNYGDVMNFGAKVWLVWSIPLIGRSLGSCLFKVESAPLLWGLGVVGPCVHRAQAPSPDPGIDPSDCQACALLMD